MYVQHIRPLIWSLAILGLLIFGGIHSYLITIQQVAAEKIISVSLTSAVPHYSQNFTRQTLEIELKKQQRILELQPQHTAVLLNISLLQKALQNQRESYLTWEAAQKLDPNNPIFNQ
jgi:hypothetical protein